MADCLFCKIVSGEVRSEFIKESELALAFRDINPVAPQHVLVIPREHLGSAADLGPQHAQLIGEIFGMLASLAKEEGLESFRVVTNVGPDAGQTVHHLHFHLIAGRSMAWPPG